MKYLILLALNLMIVSSVLAEEPKRVTVIGQCTAEVAPDRGSINFVSEKLSTDSAKAIEEATQLNEKLRDALKNTGAKDLELVSSEYSVQERKEWEKDKNVSKGFAARLGLKAITSDIPVLSKLISVAAELGVTETSGLTTYVSEPKWLSERKACLNAAAKNAEEKARTLIETLHAKLGRVSQITERPANIGQAPAPMYMERAMMKAQVADAPTRPTVEAQKQTLMQEVEVSFLIE